MITSVDDLKSAVDGLTAGGSTNHADAFAEAVQLFDPASSNAKVIVMFTDGKTTAGPPPAPVAAAARASGVVIYCIGLVGADGIDVAVLNDWATDPDASHVAVTPDSGDLEDLFADLAANISKPGATDIVIDEVLNSDFELVSITPPARGRRHGHRNRIPPLDDLRFGSVRKRGRFPGISRPPHGSDRRRKTGQRLDHLLRRRGGTRSPSRIPS